MDNCTAFSYGSIASRRKLKEKGRPGGNSLSAMPTSCLQSKSRASHFACGRVRQEDFYEVECIYIVILGYRMRHCCKTNKNNKISKALW